ncbi:hypothetical protein K438DRAFT_2022309 [Mycena galopus ATCC 62051]|nr:hypothetical protein K438DRAFT_2022309 [Mycena galopus ATCC 62051]
MGQHPSQSRHGHIIPLLKIVAAWAVARVALAARHHAFYSSPNHTRAAPTSGASASAIGTTFAYIVSAAHNRIHCTLLKLNTYPAVFESASLPHNAPSRAAVSQLRISDGDLQPLPLSPADSEPPETLSLGDAVSSESVTSAAVSAFDAVTSALPSVVNGACVTLTTAC